MKTTKKIAFSAMLSALSVLLLLFGSLTVIGDTLCTILASFCIAIAVCEFGYKEAISIYLVATVISLIILPIRDPAYYFAAFFGYYPVIKSFSERFKKGLEYTIKIVSFSTAFIFLTLLYKIVLAPEINLSWYPIPVFIAGIVVILVYDCAMTLCITEYISKLRKLLKIDHFLK